MKLLLDQGVPRAATAVSMARGPSVVRLRDEGLDSLAVAGIVHATLSACASALVQGAMVTVRTGRVRIRRLPLVRP